MDQFTNEHLPQAARALEFIRVQLLVLASDCGTMLRENYVTREVFEAVESSLQKLLHESRAACGPPPVKPKRNDFEHLKTVGQGGFGVVDVVRHKNTQQIFAMKQIKLQYAAQRRDVLLERDILAHLDSPYVVSLLCSFETEKYLHMVMEYIGGGNVGSLLSYHGRFDVDVARFYTAELVTALEYIHRFGIIHRDLKPDNLLITCDGHIKVTDFGLAKFGSQSITCETDEDCQLVAQEFTDREICGTPGFIAPEMYLQTGYGKPVDWWATGVILYNFVYGFTPFHYAPLDKISHHVLRDDVPWPNAGYDVPGDVMSLMCELLDKNCRERLGTTGAEEVKGHSFFKDVDWDTLFAQEAPFDPQLRSEEDTSRFSVCTNVPFKSGEDGQGKSSAEAEEFCYVAFAFNQEYGSPLPLSPCTKMDLILENGKVEEEQETMEHDEGFVEVDIGSSSPHHQAVPVSVDPVGKCQDSDLLKISSTLGDVEVRLVELATDCDSKLLNGLTSLDWFVELKQKLEEILRQVDPSAPPHHVSPLPAGQHQGMDLLEATWILKYIKFQLLDLADDCGITLQNGQVGLGYFALLQMKLEEVLHEVGLVSNGASSVDSQVDVEEDASGDDDEPEGRTCQSFNPLEAASTLGSIEVQLVELAEGVCNELANTPVSPNYFVELKHHLQEILHQMDFSHHDPALPSPVHHAPPVRQRERQDSGPTPKPTYVLKFTAFQLRKLAKECNTTVKNFEVSREYCEELRMKLEGILDSVAALR